jgi:inorganic pyrophosphatase
VPRRSHSERALKDVSDLTKPIREELEKFFIATDELEDKKLNIIDWKGPKAAVQAIKDAAKSFGKACQRGGLARRLVAVRRRAILCPC